METVEKLTIDNKINILKTMIYIMEKDHPEFEEENTTGNDMMEGAKIFLKELETEK